MKLNLSLLAFFTITTILLSSMISCLQVYTPQCAHLIIPSPINYTLSNFGYIPYGQTYIGQIFLPKQGNQQLCSIQSQQYLKQKQSVIKTILLVKRGICKFTQKVLNGQKLGADFVIVYDNNTSEIPRVIMKNDGHGHLVNIPSTFISKSAGLDIIKTIKNCNNKEIYFKQYFEVFESEIVDLSLWMNLNNVIFLFNHIQNVQRQSYVLLRDFYAHDYYSVIDQYVDLSVRFRVQQGCDKISCTQLDCIGFGLNKYCIPVDLVLKDQATGKDLLLQSLRMYVLFYSLPQDKLFVWFQYMNLFDKNLCLQSVKDMEECSYQAMKKSGVSGEMIEKIKVNVTGELKKLEQVKENTENVFYKVSTQADQKNIVFYPEAVINGKNFYGLFKAHEVFEMVCNSLISQPKQCYSFIKNKTSGQVIDKTDDIWLTVLFIVVLMTFGFFVALFIYTKLIKNQVNQQISMEVNKMVENYVSLTEQSSVGNKKGGI